MMPHHVTLAPHAVTPAPRPAGRPTSSDEDTQQIPMHRWR
ncbi:hypothetical protein C8E95_1934 [Pseudonocardia autotrophica]|uniref:Uncharacterized protein n=1 Tax=Pseudonocardia autotrophica TaxID=2074 RepID=A0A1Y2MYR4_PSEAH|nr:hypothetical protein BG845_03014 [Pseudonocardia autotrophica]TDN72866.1 hypothetical protein C8E95_1934 [Pseudonocardia autotrophica]